MTERPQSGADSFVHLHAHSEFSLLDGLSRIPEMTQRVAQGMPALGTTTNQANRDSVIAAVASALDGE